MISKPASRILAAPQWRRSRRLTILKRESRSTRVEEEAEAATLAPMAIGDGLARLTGYPFEVRHSDQVMSRAAAAAEVAAAAFAYFSRLFSAVDPDIALIVADRTDWSSRQPYGLAFFNDEPGQICPGVVVLPAGNGDFWTGMVQHIRDASPSGYAALVAAYPDGEGGVDLQPFFDLVTIHELAHAFEVLGDLRLPTSWLSEIFANLAVHAFVAMHMPASLPTLETLPTVGAGSRELAARMRAEGYSTLEDLEAHYTGGDDPMSPLNYVWFQYRWQRLAAKMFQVDGEKRACAPLGLLHAKDRVPASNTRAASLAPLLRTESQPDPGTRDRGLALARGRAQPALHRSQNHRRKGEWSFVALRHSRSNLISCWRCPGEGSACGRSAQVAP